MRIRYRRADIAACIITCAASVALALIIVSHF
jgi:hypothetical protein